MEDKSAEMQDIFQKLNEKNKDIVILVAQSMKIVQDTITPSELHTNQSSPHGKSEEQKK